MEVSMKKVFRMLLLGLFLACLCSEKLAAQDYFSWDFEKVPVKEILYAISLDTGISICSDDTVDGISDFKFAGNDFERAFESFLLNARLYAEKKEGLWMVSKFRYEEHDGLISFDAYDLSASQILEKLSMKMDSVLMFDVLPGQKLSVHFKNLSPDSLMDSLAARFGNFTVMKTCGAYHFCKKVEQKKLEVSGGYVKVGKENGLWKIDVKDSKFSEVIERIFDEENHDFCWLCESDSIVKRSVFCAASFDELLERVCLQNGYEYAFSDSIFYILNASAGKEDCIKGKRSWNKFNLQFSDTKDILPVIMTRFGKLESFSVSGKPFFFVKTTSEEAVDIEELVNELDVKEDLHVMDLKYKKPSDFLEHLPSCIDKSRLYVADSNSKIYFRGTKKAYEEMVEKISLFDQPVTRISYDLLILQSDESSQNEWALNLSQKKISMGDRTSIVSQLGSVMSLNMNVLTTFGLDFAQKLQASLEKNHTSIYADTTLHGVNGKEINFQSTNTYRYRDNNLDPETGKPVYSGVTKEISSGIKIDVTGWVSGDGLITTSITASVSQQGLDTSSSTGNPPPTTEKKVTTEVCGAAGTPVILSGLIQKSYSDSVKFIFGKSKVKEKSEMVIFLIPRVETLEMKPKIDNKEEFERCRKELMQARKALEGEENGNI